MKNAVRFFSPVLFLGLLGIPLGHTAQASAQAIQWNVGPPNYYNDVGRRAFQEGVEAAHRDWDAHRDMDPWHYPQMRNPPVPREMRDRYRDAFLRGYDEGMHRVRGWDRDPDDAWRDRDNRRYDQNDRRYDQNYQRRDQDDRR